MRPLIVLLLVLGSAASAQPPASSRGVKNVTFVTDPSGAHITDNQNDALGVSGQEIPVDLDKYPKDAFLFLTFTHPQCRPEKQQILIADLKNRYPETGALRLTRNFNPVPIGIGITIVLAGAVLLWKRRSPSQPVLRVVAHDPMVGRQLGRYRITQRLGEGGMATVYKAEPVDAQANNAVAIKVLRQEVMQQDYLARFRRETQVTSRLNHPNILRLIDWGEDPEYAYLVLELIEGGTLRDRLTGQPVAPEEVWDALAPICSALTCAHQLGIVHRDLKPENLMITANGMVKITDFGLAFTVDKERLTASGTIMGTPAYMPPEQIQGGEPHPAMDQYALGVVAYELLTGKLPFSNPEIVQLIFQVLSDPVPPPSRYTDLPQGSEEVLLKMLAKNPSDRYSSIEEAATQLRKVLGG